MRNTTLKLLMNNPTVKRVYEIYNEQGSDWKLYQKRAVPYISFLHTLQETKEI